MNDLATVESTVIAHLVSALPGIQIKSYSGEFDADASRTRSFNAPALFISFLGASTVGMSSGELQATSRWAAFLVLHQGQRQTKTEKTVLSGVLNALHLSSLGIDALPIELQDFEQIASQQLGRGNLTAWVIRWQQNLTLLTDQWQADC